MPETVHWWEIRRAQSNKPASYTCPFCHARFPALAEHMLLFPEGDHGRRRHAHTACVLAARQAGRLPSRAEWAAGTRGSEPAGISGWWRRPWRRRRRAGEADGPGREPPASVS